MLSAIINYILLALVAYSNAQSSGFNFVCTGVVTSVDCANAAKLPVCATNGILYASECEFIKAHCNDVNLDVDPNGNCVAITTTTSPMVNSTANTTSSPSSMFNSTENTTSSMVNSTANTTSSPSSMFNSTENTTSSLSTISSNDNSSMATTTTMPMTTTMMVMMNTTTPPLDSLSFLCQAVVTATCPDGGSPVCGSNKVEYASICSFTKAQCYDSQIVVLNSGPCPIPTPPPTNAFDIICGFILSQSCVDDGVVLCGNDNNTYDNTCAYEQARCENDNLNVTSIGSC